MVELDPNTALSTNFRSVVSTTVAATHASNASKRVAAFKKESVSIPSF